MPDWKPIIRARLARLHGDGAWESGVVEEMEQHLEDRYRELRAAGASGDEARRRALEEMEGGAKFDARVPRVQERSDLMGNLYRDIRYSLRAMRTKPGFTLMVTGMLALGIAGNAAIFSIFDGLFLRPLPFSAADRLVDVDTTAPQWNLRFVGSSNPDSFAWREGNTTFEDIAFFDDSGVNLSWDGGEARRATAAAVTGNMLDVLKLHPALGRNFTAEEDKPKGPKVAMIGYNLWREQFHGDPSVLGRMLKIDANPYMVVGVLPKEAVFPSVREVWTPLQADRNRDGNYYLSGIGRLKPGVTIAQAQADLLRVHKAMMQDGKHTVNAETSPTLMPVRERYLGDYRDAARILMAGVGVVLLIACVNIAGLMLVRGASRGREMAIRAAMGASRGAIVRQLLTESLMLAATGATAGMALGVTLLRGMVALQPPGLPEWLTFGIDWRFLLFVAAVTAASAVLFGLAPALDASRAEPRQRLQEGARSSSSRGHRRALSALIVGEVGLALVLLISAGLLLKAFQRVVHVDPGFRPANTVTFGVWLPLPRYEKTEKMVQFYNALHEKLRALPGVEAASAVDNVPFGGHRGYFYHAVEGYVENPKEKMPVVLDQSALPDYFDTLGIRFIAGRGFSPDEAASNKHRVAVINESFAKYFFPGVNPVGKHIKQRGEGPEYEVVGVTADTKHYGLDQEMRPSVIRPYGQHQSENMTIVLRTPLEPHAVVSAAREALRSLDPDVPMGQVLTMNDRMEKSLWTRRAYSWLFGAFAMLAVLLAAAGVYGVTSYVVGQRRREIGIRIALGAVPSQILGNVLRSGMTLVSIGIVLGVGGAIATSRFVETLLFGVKANDFRVYLTVIAGVVAVGLLANLVPARRAASTDPMRSLRIE